MWCKQEKDIPYLFGGAYAYAYSYFWHSFINFPHAYITADSCKLSKFLNKYDFADIPYNFWHILFSCSFDNVAYNFKIYKQICCGDGKER